MSAILTPREQAALDAGFDAASKAFVDGARDCARQSAYALAELAAEREQVRRWKARLRWRAEHADEECADRLQARGRNARSRRVHALHLEMLDDLVSDGTISATDAVDIAGSPLIEECEHWPIAGPKPGRFLP